MKNKIFVFLLLAILLISNVNAALIFRPDVATEIIVRGVLSTFPNGRILLTAYKWATDPTGSALGFLPGEVSNALKVVMGADPIELFKDIALNKAQQEVLKGILEKLPPEQQLAVLNAQQYASYAKAVFQIKNEKEAEALAPKHDEKTGMYTFKDKEGKELMALNIEKFEFSSNNSNILIKAKEDGQEFRFKDQAKIFMKKDGSIEIKGKEITKADFETSKESVFSLCNNKQITVPADTKIIIDCKQNLIFVGAKEFLFGKGEEEKKIDILGKNVKISQNELKGYFEVNGIEFGSPERESIARIEKEGYVLKRGQAVMHKEGINIFAYSSESIREGKTIFLDEEVLLTSLHESAIPEKYQNIISYNEGLVARGKILAITLLPGSKFAQVETKDELKFTLNGGKVVIDKGTANVYIDFEKDPEQYVIYRNGRFNIKYDANGAHLSTRLFGTTPVPDSVPQNVYFEHEGKKYLFKIENGNSGSALVEGTPKEILTFNLGRKSRFERTFESVGKTYVMPKEIGERELIIFSETAEKEDSFLFVKRGKTQRWIDIGRVLETKELEVEAAVEEDMEYIIKSLKEGDDVTFYHNHPAISIYNSKPSAEDFYTNAFWKMQFEDELKMNPSVAVTPFGLWEYETPSLDKFVDFIMGEPTKESLEIMREVEGDEYNKCREKVAAEQGFGLPHIRWYASCISNVCHDFGLKEFDRAVDRNINCMRAAGFHLNFIPKEQIIPKEEKAFVIQ